MLQALPAGDRTGASVRARFGAWVTVWMLAVPFGLGAESAWQKGPSSQFRTLDFPSSARVGFRLLPSAQTGINFTNTLDDRTAAKNQVLLSGSGVAGGDVDGDGLCDVYFCRIEGPNVLYRNLGNWKFADITTAAGVACPNQHSTGAAFVDVDGDGDLDLLVNGVGAGTRLFRNDGKGHFEEVIQSGLVRQYGSMCMALGDLDGDDYPDLYVANYRTATVRSTGFDLLVMGNRRMVRPEDQDRLLITPEGFVREYGEPDFCYRNDGQGHFVLLSWTDGTFLDAEGQPLTAAPKDWSYSVMIRDLNEDGAPDLYVCGDFWSPDRCWINDGRGHFRALPREALPCTSSFSMGLDVADINRDGHDDILVLDMLSPNHVRRLTQTVLFGLQRQPLGFPRERPEVGRNVLFLSRGDGTYAEVAYLAGLHASEWSWCPVFLDVDLDGYEDVLITSGHGFDTQDADAEQRIRAKGPWPREKVPEKLWEYPRLNLPNLAFRNQGDLTFKDMSQAWGFDLNGISQGIALADLDNDGDLDVAINNMNMAAALYRNDSGAPRLAVRLRGRRPNTSGIGAKIQVLGGPVLQSQQIVCGGRFDSSDEALRVFAAGSLTNDLTIEVAWRDGSRTVVTGARPNRLYEVEQPMAPGSDSVARAPAGKPAPLFVEVSAELGHRHPEAAFDDFTRQPGLPHGLSRMGPGLTWFDVDGDGWDDLIIAGGRGGTLGVYHNDEGRRFTALGGAPFDEPLAREQTTVLGWLREGGQRMLLAGSSNYEDGRPAGAMVRAYEPDVSRCSDLLPGAAPSVGPLAMADYDGDGVLDLFVGGRVIPGRYPESASSFLFRNRRGHFELDLENTARLAEVGLVNGAVWADVNGDGQPDLVLGCEWGPVRVFLNEGGQLREATQAWGLAPFTGWWNGVAVGDFDGDGALDLVAANWGRNTRYEPYRAQPLRLYYGDFSGAGALDLLEAYYDPAMQRVVPWRSLNSVATSLPFVREQFVSHRAYAEADVDAILGERRALAREVQVRWLETTVFLNRGHRFVAQPLPLEAQLAPAVGVCVADFDGDGAEDIFLSQNFFDVHPEDSPYGSGRGLWLRGNGQGGFAAVPARQAGVEVYGEQRGVAVADYDGDGRPDLAVAQNGDPTKLFHNVGARPGLRIHLTGPPANPQAIGAVIRLAFGSRLGPAREIHAGSGHWSQDSAVSVMGVPEPPTAIWVRWPGGKTTLAPLSRDAREVTVAADAPMMTTPLPKVPPRQ